MKTISLIVILIVGLFANISPELKQFDKVYVEWIDIVQTDSGWHSSEQIEQWLIEEQDTVRQIGFIYKSTTRHYVLIDSYFSDQYLGAAIKIPKCNVVLIKKLN